MCVIAVERWCRSNAKYMIVLSHFKGHMISASLIDSFIFCVLLVGFFVLRSVPNIRLYRTTAAQVIEILRSAVFVFCFIAAAAEQLCVAALRNVCHSFRAFVARPVLACVRVKQPNRDGTWRRSHTWRPRRVCWPASASTKSSCATALSPVSVAIEAAAVFYEAFFLRV